MICIEKDKKGRRMVKTGKDGKNKVIVKSSKKCYYCGRDRHAANGKKGWKEKCPAKKQHVPNVSRLVLSRICPHVE